MIFVILLAVMIMRYARDKEIAEYSRKKRGDF